MILSYVDQALTRGSHLTSQLFSFARMAGVRLGTLPYYRLYHFNTADPIQKIASIASEQPRSSKLLHAVTLWRERKLTELHFISIACAILAAAVIGSFSWTTIDRAYWLTPGLWYASLVLSVLGILISAQQVAVLNFLGPPPSPGKVRQMERCFDRYLPVLLSKNGTQYYPRQKMVFTWQCPLMFMSYSVCSFLAGITILVCTPLIHREGSWNAGCNIAVMYLSICSVAGATFVFCGFWIYHYVDLGFDTHQDGSDGEEFDESGEQLTRPSRVTSTIAEMIPPSFGFSDPGSHAGLSMKRGTY